MSFLLKLYQYQFGPDLNLLCANFRLLGKHALHYRWPCLTSKSGLSLVYVSAGECPWDSKPDWLSLLS